MWSGQALKPPDGDSELNNDVFQDIVWPGQALKPPDGVPERRFLTITFLEVNRTSKCCVRETIKWMLKISISKYHKEYILKI